MGYIDVSAVSLTLPDGRPLLDEVSFRVGEGATSALIGANGAGKSTLLKIIRGEVKPDSGVVSIDGGLGVMDQFVGHLRDDSTVRDLLISVAPPAVRCRRPRPRRGRERPHRRRHDAEPDGVRDGARRLRGCRRLRAGDGLGPVHGRGPRHPVRARQVPRGQQPERRRAEAPRARGAAARTRPGAAARRAGQLPRRARQALARGASCARRQKTVLLVSHDRELLAQAADRLITLELGGAGNTTWTHGGGFAHLPRGAPRPHGPPRRAQAPLGRAARQAQAAGRDAQGEGGGERRLRLALSRRA